jgi:hypothetical protein
MGQFNYNSGLVQSNMEEVLDMSTFSIYKQGREWYPKAHEKATDFGKKYNREVDIVCGLISVFSPQKSWGHNLKLTEQYLKEGRAGHTSTQLGKGKLISNYTNNYTIDGRHSFIERMLGGNKTINFFYNILNPKDDRYCTIDGHMIQLMTGQMDNLHLTSKQYNFLKGELIVFAKRYKRVPSEMQAILWIIWKQNKFGK